MKAQRFFRWIGLSVVMLPALAAAATGSTTLQIEFPGMRNVHADVFPADGVAGQVTGHRIARANWKSDGASVMLPPGIYDLRLRQGGGVQVVDDVDCRAGSCRVDGLSATMTVRFPGLSSVHTRVLSSTGARVVDSNWKHDSTEIHVFPQVYSVSVRKGGATQTVTEVDCRSGTCEVDGLVATLTVNFPGLSGVHASVFPDDGSPGVVSGDKMISANWKTSQAVIPVFRQVFDLQLRKGAASYVVDGVDCSQGSCRVDGLVNTLTVNFEGLSSVHTRVLLADGVIGEAGGDKVTDANWRSNQALIKVLPGVYDLIIRKGASSKVVDAVDCSAGDCSVGELTRELTVRFPGLGSVHTSVRRSDGIVGEAGGDEVTHANWRRDGAVIKVFAGVYDVRVRKGGASWVIDDVNCRSGECVVEDIVRTLSIDFPGMSSVHSRASVDDGVLGEAGGNKVADANWKTDHAEIKLLPGIYDVKIRKGGSSHIVDAVDCVQADCHVGDLVRTVTVNFPGLNSVHSSLHVPDGVDDQAGGERVTRANWQRDSAELTVFPGIYDLLVRKGAGRYVVDNVDCRRSNCEVSGLVRTLRVEFDGLSSVHTGVYVPDGKPGEVGDGKVTDANWRSEFAEITVFPGLYDLKIRKGGASHIVDNVDCRAADCVVSDLVRRMTVKFPGMASVHTSVRIDDGKRQQAEGAEVQHANWKKEQTVITVFPGVYDLRIRKGKATHIVDAVDCRDEDCEVDGIVRTLTVNFEGLSSVHASVRVPDGVDGVADGGELGHANWKKNRAEIAVFPARYDLRVRKGGATLVVDDVDCSASGPCEANDLTATLAVEFPGLTGVHTDVRVPDGVAGTASGALIIRANWQSHATSIVLLRQVVDLRVRHGLTTIFDDVDCRGGNCSAVVEGNLQVSLINGDANAAIPGQPISAYEKTATGDLIKAQTIITSPEGRANFSLPGLAEGKVFVLKVSNPLGNSQGFFSALIDSAGPFDFIVSAGGQTTLDLTPPQLAFNTPLNGGNVSINGFEVHGSASDDRQLASVVVSVGGVSLPAVIDPASGGWQVDVPASALAIGQALRLDATATDLARNATQASITVTPVVDQDAPVIAFLSHQDQDAVQETGFLLSGIVTDLTGVASLTVTLSDPTLGDSITARPVQVAADSGAWTVAVNNSDLSSPGPAGSAITVTLDAVDQDGNAGSASIVLQVVAVDTSGLHLINRITFGATPALIDEVATLGPDGFLDQQLNPADIDDSAFEARISGVTPTTREQLQNWTLLHMVYSRRQLQEVMTWFWDNHFNTNIDTTRMNADGVDVSDTAAFELAENQAFRANALGNFANLLEASAKSPAMLIYLDSISNVAADANENYPREVMELHTLGIAAGYTDADVAAASELLTGWTVRDGAFFFDSANHNPAAQTVLGRTFPAGGVEQGEQFLQMLATHPSTAHFICGKLVTLLVDDTPPTALISRCAATFLSTSAEPDQIALVLDEILNSPEFFAVYRNKIKTPVELVVGALRNLDAETDASDLAGPMGAMGLRLYQNPVPTGYSERGDDWINASLLLERMKWVNAVARRQPATTGSYTEPGVFFPAQGVETAEGIVNFLLQLTVADDHGDLEVQQAVQMLQGINGFDLSDPDADSRLRQLEGAVLSYPQYQFQ